MSALEQEIIEKFHLLEPDAKQRVLETLTLDTQAASFDYDAWWAQVEALQAEIRASYGKDSHIDVVRLLREIREDED